MIINKCHMWYSTKVTEFGAVSTKYCNNAAGHVAGSLPDKTPILNDRGICRTRRTARRQNRFSTKFVVVLPKCSPFSKTTLSLSRPSLVRSEPAWHGFDQNSVNFSNGPTSPT